MSGIVNAGIKALKKLMPKKSSRIKEVDLADEVAETASKKTDSASEAAKKADAEHAEKLKLMKEKESEARAEYGRKAARWASINKESDEIKYKYEARKKRWAEENERLKNKADAAQREREESKKVEKKSSK